MINNINDAFRTANINNNALSFPLEISPSIYNKAKTMLSNIRGKYVGKAEHGRFEFPFDPTEIIGKFLVNNEWPKKNPFALFPTPQVIIDYAIEYTFAGANMWAGYEMVRILEPSAGRGDFIDEIVADFKKSGIKYCVTCVEIDPVNIAILKSKGYSVIEGDFLNVEVESLEKYDLIITNPPFQRETYIRHVNHSLKFLNKHGKMMAVIPSKLFASQTKIGEELKQRVAANNIGEFHDCIFEKGTFENTAEETMLVTLSSAEADELTKESTIDYAAKLMCLCLNNINHVNEKINGCKSDKALDDLMPYLINTFLDEDPYAFLNKDVVRIAKNNFAISLELNDICVVKAKPISIPDILESASTQEVHIEPKIKNVFNEIDLIQLEISNVLVSVETKCKLKKIKPLKSTPKRKRQQENCQMDMFALA